MIFRPLGRPYHKTRNARGTKKATARFTERPPPVINPQNQNIKHPLRANGKIAKCFVFRLQKYYHPSIQQITKVRQKQHNHSLELGKGDVIA